MDTNMENKIRNNPKIIWQNDLLQIEEEYKQGPSVMGMSGYSEPGYFYDHYTLAAKDGSWRFPIQNKEFAEAAIKTFQSAEPKSQEKTRATVELRAARTKAANKSFHECMFSGNYEDSGMWNFSDDLDNYSCDVLLSDEDTGHKTRYIYRVVFEPNSAVIERARLESY